MKYESMTNPHIIVDERYMRCMCGHYNSKPIFCADILIVVKEADCIELQLTIDALTKDCNGGE